MGKKARMSKPRVVIDTNCLVSALIFSRDQFAWLREAWQAKRFVALASRDTVSELLRVLAYPKFKLSHDEQETLLAEFLPFVETVSIETTPGGLPEIRDAEDVIFLVLAAVAKADALVSGDGDIQAVKAQFQIPILTVAEFADWLQAQ
ncbi:putative toxin-antitoxin system toxin component, PIN family [Thiorhodovibrio frisius]|uniref:Putative toxin-antitoxin system toxin component, PIN family n=2 Tax=Thiorhodovibrio frisius TaxID=631362 RepID=H8YXQ7_9GAMM|nr:putative toxin-antitoxin system toxin component, PIN family [Thiorhodovibrio frisius]WPL23691.1 putative toxin-antitoxin system toxin component, PIN family [Thiorhodovibrio frisius]